MCVNVLTRKLSTPGATRLEFEISILHRRVGSKENQHEKVYLGCSRFRRCLMMKAGIHGRQTTTTGSGRTTKTGKHLVSGRTGRKQNRIVLMFFYHELEAWEEQDHHCEEAVPDPLEVLQQWD